MQSPTYRRSRLDSKRGAAKRVIWCALAMLAAILVSVLARPAAAQPFPGDVGKAPLFDRLQKAIVASIEEQLLEPGRAEIRFIVHFPGTRGDNGRVCGEVIEPTADGKPRVRTFFSIYTRAGRVLTRLEDEPFEEYLAGDTVFKNCRPRL